jgi:EmrB/QacA subfamily drug resistance transporter
MQWVISAYSLTLAALTITGGRLGDLFGRKKMFMLGALLFAIGSFIASISQSVSVLIIGESIIEGIGAALMMPATSSLIVANYRGRDRAIAFGVWGGVAAAALAIGPVLGGYLTTYYSWRWGFRINVFVVIILLLGSYLIKESSDERPRHKIDVLGIILSALGLLAIVFGIIEASTYGWWHATTVFSINGTSITFLGNLSVSVFAFIWGIIFLIVFALWEIRLERKNKVPLVSLHLFENRQFTAGIFTQSIIALGQSGTILLIVLFLESVRHLDALHTGYSLIPMAITLFIASPLSAYLSKYIAPKVIIMTGLAINVVALIYLQILISPTATVWTFAPALGLYGIGMGCVVSQISNLTLSAVDIREAGEASGINSTMRLIGQAFGSAIVGAVLLSTLTTLFVKNINESSTIPEPLKPALTEEVTALHSNLEFGGVEKLKSQTSDFYVQTELEYISTKALTQANKNAIVAGIIIMALGFISTAFLPKQQNKSESENNTITTE